MRRSSLVAPLLLIAIGALFLARNIWPELPLMQAVALYWPYILIAWGGLRLIEILFWAARSRPLPAAGISGGEWVLVVFVALLGSGVAAAYRYHGYWAPGGIRIRGIEVFGETFDYPVDARKAQAGKTPRVVIEHLRGNVRIVGGDGEEVSVTGRKTIRALRESEADRAHKQTPAEIVVQGNQVIVRTNQERVTGEQRVSADLDITVPKGASIQTRGRSGDFDVHMVGGTVDIESDRAGVRLEEIGGEVRIKLQSSDIIRCINLKSSLELRGRGQDVELENVQGQVIINGLYAGELQFRNLAKPLIFEGAQTEFRVERVPGEIRMARSNFTASNLVGPVRLNTRSRDVHIDGFTESLEVNVNRGDVELRPGTPQLGRMDVKTRSSGHISLELPESAKFDLKANTSRGEVTNHYGEPLTVDKDGRGATLAGSVGVGPTLRLEADRGSITVTKAGRGETALQPPAPRRLKVEEQ